MVLYRKKLNDLQENGPPHCRAEDCAVSAVRKLGVGRDRDGAEMRNSQTM